MKKIARRQSQDGGKGKKDGENGEKSKLKSPSDKKDEDSESDSSFIGHTESNGRDNFTFYHILSTSILLSKTLLKTIELSFLCFIKKVRPVFFSTVTLLNPDFSML